MCHKPKTHPLGLDPHQSGLPPTAPSGKVRATDRGLGWAGVGWVFGVGKGPGPRSAAFVVDHVPGLNILFSRAIQRARGPPPDRPDC